MNCNHKKKIQIRFGDIDIMGHVNNGVQLSYLDLGRLDYFEQVYGQTIDWNDAALLVAHLEIDYLAPILLKDKIEDALYGHSKKDQEGILSDLEEELIIHIEKTFSEEKISQAKIDFEKEINKIVHKNILEKEKRLANRGPRRYTGFNNSYLRRSWRRTDA